MTIYQKYLEEEKGSPEQGRIQLLYERIVADLPSDGMMFTDYCKFASRQRNLTLEQCTCAFQFYLTSPRVVWLAFNEYIVRNSIWTNEGDIQKVREAFTNATTHMTTNI